MKSLCRKRKKFQMSSHLLGVTPNRWPTNFFLQFRSCAWSKRYFFHDFRIFFIVFDHAGWNTQHAYISGFNPHNQFSVQICEPLQKSSFVSKMIILHVVHKRAVIKTGYKCAPIPVYLCNKPWWFCSTITMCNLL